MERYEREENIELDQLEVERERYQRNYEFCQMQPTKVLTALLVQYNINGRGSLTTKSAKCNALAQYHAFDYREVNQNLLYNRPEFYGQFEPNKYNVPVPIAGKFAPRKLQLQSGQLAPPLRGPSSPPRKLSPRKMISPPVRKVSPLPMRKASPPPMRKASPPPIRRLSPQGEILTEGFFPTERSAYQRRQSPPKRAYSKRKPFNPDEPLPLPEHRGEPLPLPYDVPPPHNFPPLPRYKEFSPSRESGVEFGKVFDCDKFSYKEFKKLMSQYNIPNKSKITTKEAMCHALNFYIKS